MEFKDDDRGSENICPSTDDEEEDPVAVKYLSRMSFLCLSSSCLILSE